MRVPVPTHLQLLSGGSRLPLNETKESVVGACLHDEGWGRADFRFVILVRRCRFAQRLVLPSGPLDDHGAVHF